ncbi:hypothetical protein TcasGA2_TC005642 [Tribolium castaneum]|uniref:Uncharacterized protein n=1 Tax=Tribolium castaneum TaxID=7070 RepID=D6WX40_TRICA|nr:hypothetical protein TcasGA2_TC005642 [Tribolium castaneum]
MCGRECVENLRRYLWVSPAVHLSPQGRIAGIAQGVLLARLGPGAEEKILILIHGRPDFGHGWVVKDAYDGHIHDAVMCDDHLPLQLFRSSSSPITRRKIE